MVKFDKNLLQSASSLFRMISRGIERQPRHPQQIGQRLAGYVGITGEVPSSVIQCSHGRATIFGVAGLPWRSSPCAFRWVAQVLSSFLTSSPETIPNRPSVMIIDNPHKPGSRTGPQCQGLGDLIPGVRKDRVERIECNM